MLTLAQNIALVLIAAALLCCGPLLDNFDAADPESFRIVEVR